jgi:DNA-directed RNA polymerase subunit beta'
VLFSDYLINQNMPDKYKFEGSITKKELSQNLTRLAKDRPKDYPDIVQNLKRVGDMFATYEGISVGLDDITPDYKSRDKLIADAQKKISSAKTDTQRISVLLDAQKKGLDTLGNNKGSLKRQVDSGSRGKSGQLLKTIFSPVVAKGKNDIPQPYLIDKSYAEGLSPSQFWLTAGESRRELAQTQLATAIPGDTSKQISATLNGVIVTKPDCGTRNGIEMDPDDHHMLDRYEAGTNRLITQDYQRTLKRKKKPYILVRSPMTCLESPGVCQKCYGRNMEGQVHSIGTNVGLRASQSMSEPLTQMILSAKHGGQMAKGEEAKLSGTMGFRQLLDMPKIFKNKATLSTVRGTVSKTEKSPQGGNFIYVDNDKHYVDPKREIIVKKGQKVTPGQMLSDGVPHPQEVVALRGLGAGRKYVSDTIFDIFKDSGVDIDKRHVEILTKQDLNSVKITKGDDEGVFTRGDIAPYNKVRDYLSSDSRKSRLGKGVIGKRLGSDYGHHTSGTTITPEIYDDLKKKKIREVALSNDSVQFEPVMRPLEQIPLMSQDWVTRLAHRRIKDTLLEGAAQAWESDTRSTAPYPAVIYGSPRFGETERGHY